ncbi:MAG: YkgJ family cysteine cluster protein [Acidobacteria bacterium]|nr:YkgJ family cysteine cluster protein [Acidobacteriota bacterium]
MKRDRALVRRIDDAMAEAVRRSGKWVVCRLGCTECCQGEFEITALDGLRLRAGMEQLGEEEAGRIRARAAEWSGEGACPLLEVESGACLLYEWRPLTGRTFGPATTTLEDGGIAVCEKCYAGASAQETALCAVSVDDQGLERELLAELREPAGPLTVARALLDY